MACSLSLSAPCQLLVLAGPGHGRTIPLTDIGEQTTIGRIAAKLWIIFAESNKLQLEIPGTVVFE
ncbi:hypothetical protein XI09_09020 [Bradyrhizobium sp. CCBAU 11386]|nr:hypothetical protein [Bradyrhizobium sp. CCBAU 11386]